MNYDNNSQSERADSDSQHQAGLYTQMHSNKTKGEPWEWELGCKKFFFQTHRKRTRLLMSNNKVLQTLAIKIL